MDSLFQQIKFRKNNESANQRKESVTWHDSRTALRSPFSEIARSFSRYAKFFLNSSETNKNNQSGSSAAKQENLKISGPEKN